MSDTALHPSSAPTPSAAAGGVSTAVIPAPRPWFPWRGLPVGTLRPWRMLSRNAELSTMDGILATPLVWLTLPGNFIVAAMLTQYFALGKETYGLICALPFIANALQLLIAPVAERWWGLKRVTLTFAWIHISLWLAMVATLPFLPKGSPEVATPFFVTIFAAMAICGSVAGSAWTAWVQELLPQRIRGSYFGFRNQLCQFSMIAFLGVAMGVSAWLGNGLITYLLLLGVPGIARFMALNYQQCVMTPPARETKQRPGMLQELQAALGNWPLIGFVLFAAVLGLLMNLAGSYYAPFMYEVLQRDISFPAWLGIITSVFAALAFPFWGKLTDRYGAKPVMIACLLLWETPNLLWGLLTPDTSWVLFFMAANGGLFMVGFQVASFAFLLKLVDPATKGISVSLNLAITSVTAAVGTYLGGWLLQHAGEFGWSQEMLYRVGFVAKSLLVALLTLWLFRMHEPTAARVSDVFGALRSFRHSLQTHGLAIMANIRPVLWGQKKATRPQGRSSTPSPK